MRTLRKTRQLALLACLLFSAGLYAQESDDSGAPPIPDLSSLATTWWEYFEYPGDDKAARVESFLSSVDVRIAAMQPSNKPAALSIRGAISENMRAYLSLLGDVDTMPLFVPEPALSYSIDEFLALATIARSAGDTASVEELEVDRERRILDDVTRRRDAAFKSYVGAAAGDERLLAALRLVQNRSAQAISARRLQILTQRYSRAKGYADESANRVTYAIQRLATTPETAELIEQKKRIAEQEAQVVVSQELLRAAELTATGLNLDTEQGRSQQLLQQQKMVDAQVSLALEEIKLASAQARRWWTVVVLAATPEMNLLEEQSLGWSVLLRRIDSGKLAWQRSTEDELLAVQAVSRVALSRATRRLLDERLETAQGSLNKINILNNEIADLELISQAVDSAVSEYSGALSSWLTSLSRGLKTVWLQFKGLGSVTLFSVGEAPVTGADILRVLIILSVAFLLSRFIRFALARVGRKDSSGTQASLYTVGRLTHYAIVFIAIIIALSSIGLDFSNLALIAGALGVGIGFGLQSIVSNFVSGLIILFEHSLRVGDYVELDTGLTGTVKAINVRSTLINTNDNIDIVVPNSEFVTTRLTNWTLAERILRVRIPFGVAYGSDKEMVKKAAQEAAAEVPYTLTHMKGREPDVWLVNFGDSSLDFLLLVWVNRQGARRPTRTRAAYLWALESKLREYGIEIPFPQRDLNLRGGWQGKEVASRVLEEDIVEVEEPDKDD